MMKVKAAVWTAVLVISTVGTASAARPAPAPIFPAKGSHFESVGSVSLHVGQPCSSQIMFDFHVGTRMTWLAAPKRETGVLTEAARRRQKVRISGLWRRGAQTGCAFVEVTQVVVERKILGIF